MKSPTVAAIAIIQKDELILGVSRPDDHANFGLPGGQVEPGETAAQAARREVKEETNLDIDDVVEVPFRHPGRYANVTAFTATATGSIVASDEGAVKWCTKDELMAGRYGDYNRALFEFMRLI